MAAKVNSMPDVAVRPLGSGPPPYNSFGGPPPHHVTDHDRGSSYMLEGAVGVSLMHHEPPPKPDGFYKTWIFGKVLDPRSKTIIAWNRVFLLSRFWALAIEPLFLYTVAISPHRYCFYIDGWFGIFVTLFRCVSDLMHLWHIWLQLKLAYVARKSLVLGSGKLVWDARMVALHYLRPSGGFVFDLFVVFPILQIVIWGVVPEMIRRGGKMSGMMTSILVAFAIQFVYKVFHLITLVPRMQRVTGYVFGTAWWGFALNLTAYFVAAHAAGACWYLLALQRISSCLYDQCKMKAGCNARDLGSSHAILYGPRFSDPSPLTSAKLYADVAPTCLENKGDVFKYGIFITALPLTTSRNFLNRILYPIFWGLMTLSSFGNAMVPSNQMLEVIFSILVITCGLMLFTLLIGNIQVFLHSMTAKKEEMRLKIRDLEVWMKRRQLPSRLRHRVRQYERQKWAALRGVDEHAMVRELPEGVRRDVKRHLCLDLVRQVPLFYQMDEIVLDTICDRVKPLMFIKGETVSIEPRNHPKVCFSCTVVSFHVDLANRRPSAADAIHCPGEAAKHPQPEREQDEYLHHGARELLRGRASVVVPQEAIRRPASPVHCDAEVLGLGGSLRIRSSRPQVRDRPLPDRVCEREAQADREILLVRMEDLGRGYHSAGLEAFQGGQGLSSGASENIERPWWCWTGTEAQHRCLGLGQASHVHCDVLVSKAAGSSLKHSRKKVLSFI
ncbi:cyclic nucleotide-gated ion channel 2 isoform X1 [Selaginella moellendorffii]|uniref:cyclic nucleotide-gated ion channel 2 isoform X1 n=1 Tax=Selaginella moellendorffii TaxID=88036 RepID=UPI000D1CBE2E|nr:cyclic nucleotide-gated ion channel 2 isoform X1 [Selaginella moellendorffii]|eukprot:XP_024537641.1 cyclic nucleotide-gated ion channel 2 isoform X1 [Selaginella moellendorffii]